MNSFTEFLVRRGAVVLFAAVFVEQIGIPLPSALWLFAAGALIGAGKMNWFIALGSAALGSLVADFIWFYMGRRYGHRVLGLLCRISSGTGYMRTPDPGRVHALRGKGNYRREIHSGLSTLAPPLAGSSGIGAHRFFLLDTAGSVLYVGSFILVGVLFSRQLEQIIAALAGLGNGALAVVAGLAALYIGYKYYQRRRLLRALRTARITVDELHKKLEAGETLMILDLRPNTELAQDPARIRGALHMTMDEIEHRQNEIPRDRDIILYCSCPNEVSSARMALRLQRKGFSRVRPLQGGIDAWRKRNYPTDLHSD